MVTLSATDGTVARVEAYVNLCHLTYMMDGPWMQLQSNVPVHMGYLVYRLDVRDPLTYSGAFSLRIEGTEGMDRLTKLPTAEIALTV